MGLIRALNGIFQVDFYLGEYRFRKNLKSEGEARHLLRIIENKVLTKESNLSDAISLYLSNVSSHKSEKSARIDKFILLKLSAYVTPEEGEKKPLVSSIKASQMESFRESLIGGGMASSSVNRYFNTIKHFFRKCEEWQYIDRSPAKFVRALPARALRRQPWTEDEIKIARGTLMPVELAIFDSLLLTGARLSQLTSLKRKDVDIANRTIVLKSKKGPTAQEKSYLIPLSARVEDILRPMLLNKSASDYVYLTISGEPVCPALFSKNFKRRLIRKKLIASHLTLHGLRHTFASRLDKMGASINDIRALLGHSSTKITETYVHSNLDNLRQYFI